VPWYLYQPTIYLLYFRSTAPNRPSRESFGPVQMATQVEARSLSAINFLAANPPQYPVNPTEERHEALTLYISRVPGSRGTAQGAP